MSSSSSGEKAAFLNNKSVAAVELDRLDCARHGVTEQYFPITACSGQVLEEEALVGDQLAHETAEQAAFAFSLNVDGRGHSDHRVGFGLDLLSSGETATDERESLVVQNFVLHGQKLLSRTKYIRKGNARLNKSNRPLPGGEPLAQRRWNAYRRSAKR